jgi:hypothetical protein
MLIRHRPEGPNRETGKQGAFIFVHLKQLDFDDPTV